MDKQILISSVTSKLNKLGIKYSLGEETDISINCEFVNNLWKIGNEKIDYHVCAYFNEEVSTVLVWEMAKESSWGLSFAFENEASFQCGTAVCRIVKGIQYDDEGKAYEYSFDLSDIIRIFKYTAKENGWKFKTVIRKKKALYPVKYSNAVDG
ncbi:hypothetical protein HBE96_12195 [Clostridium sp. P21]|uniref:Uncharacterized protein n=1 Tax=Clostridium muellerianum TaxID=2716538 RepID=A0A7Y0EHD4_9CLOT|nr:hypothetical protein [Clostridium muellerianum]NMM63426.1 hypothetical protein [Clostridium muellerianum]